MIGTTTDVEDRYQVTVLEELRATDERTRLAESAPKWACGREADKRLAWSEGFARLFELGPEEHPAMETPRQPSVKRTASTSSSSSCSVVITGIDAEFRFRPTAALVGFCTREASAGTESSRRGW
jgi:hypothetical protein